jgi:uncharacterized repeat protein (TIGR01451 family)
MRLTRSLGPAAPLLVALLVLSAPQAADAVGTLSGTSIDNTATCDYDVGGIPQTPVNGAVSFVVDNKIDLTVTTVDVAAVEGNPGSTNHALTFTLLNAGNTVQDYSLAAQGASGTLFGVTDDFDMNNVREFVDTNGNGTYDDGVDTDTYVDELAADSTIVVFIVADFPLSAGDGEGALYDLIAQTAEGGSAGSQGADITSDDAGIPDRPDTVDLVFADGAGTADAANDGKYSDRSAYKAISASLTVAKTSAVISDPINGGVNPKAIPGATLRYTVTVTNNGTEDADSVVLVDQTPVNTTYVGETITLDGGPLTDAGGDDAGDYGVTNPNSVTVSIGTLAASGGSAVVTFDVTVD